jgi:hypothetical protein
MLDLTLRTCHAEDDTLCKTLASFTGQITVIHHRQIFHCGNLCEPTARITRERTVPAVPRAGGVTFVQRRSVDRIY